MRVLLVSANREHIPDPIFPLGLSYIAAAAQQAGHEVGVADLCFGRQPMDHLQRRIRAFRPEVVGVSIRNIDSAAFPGVHRHFEEHLELARACKRRGFGWKRWSNQWIYDKLGLFNEYRVKYRDSMVKAFPDR